ncbi:hypothetical protein LCGC14_2280050, partial [marine sediment metagenome]
VSFANSGNTYKHIVWVAHDKDMLPMKFQSFLNGELQKEVIVENVGFVETDLGGIWFPKIANRTVNNKYYGNMTYKIDVRSFSPNFSINEKSFRVEFPPGAEIIDTVQNLMYTRVGKNIDSTPEFNVIENSDQEKPAQNARMGKSTPSTKTSVKVNSDTQNDDIVKASKVNDNQNLVASTKKLNIVITVCVLFVAVLVFGILFKKKVR